MNIKDIRSIELEVQEHLSKMEYLYNNNLNFLNVPVRDIMKEYINLPIYVDNDANCAALAESVKGAAKDYNSSITITLGTGIGSGIIIDNRIYNGFNSAASELGHMVICVDGIECSCGRKGCWERYASATSLILQTKKAVKKDKNSIIHELIDGDLAKIDAKTAFDAAKKNDELGLKIIKQYIHYLAEGLVNTINIFQPEIVLIGGGVSKEGDYLLNPLRMNVEKSIYSHKYIKNTQIGRAQMGNLAGIIGAAMLGNYQ